MSPSYDALVEKEKEVLSSVARHQADQEAFASEFVRDFAAWIDAPAGQVGFTQDDFQHKIGGFVWTKIFAQLSRKRLTIEFLVRKDSQTLVFQAPYVPGGEIQMPAHSKSLLEQAKQTAFGFIYGQLEDFLADLGKAILPESAKKD